MKTARTPGAYSSAITHVGRRSGRVYETPAKPPIADKATARKSAIWVGVLWIMATVFPASSILP